MAFNANANQLAKMIPNPGFVDLDRLVHRLLVTHRGGSFILDEAVNPESAKESVRYHIARDSDRNS
jgi:hypothetical protein